MYFVSDMDDIKPEIKAVGLIKDNSEALLIEVNTSNYSIKSVVRDYKPADAEELAAFQSILGTVSPVNSNRIVPVNLERVSNNSFEFSYYDGFYFNCCWLVGYATYFTNNQTVMWMVHTA